MKKNFVASLFAAALALCASFPAAHAMPPQNPLVKPDLAAAAAPEAKKVAQSVLKEPLPSMGIPPNFSSMTTDAKAAPEVNPLAGLYVSTIFGSRAILRAAQHVPAVSSPVALGLPPMNVAGGVQTPAPSMPGATRGLVLHVADGQTIDLLDGSAAKVRVFGDGVVITSLTTKKTLFSGFVESTAVASYTPADQSLIKPDPTYKRAAFIKPLAASTGVTPASIPGQAAPAP